MCILENIDLGACFSLAKDSDLRADLFASLNKIEEAGRDDFKLFVTLFEQSTREVPKKPEAFALDLNPLPFHYDFN